MAKKTQQQIYWANSMFGQADREFNAKCAAILRDNGYDVFLPQEAVVNKGEGKSSPTADNIFRVDTTAIVNSNILVACIDQESIDCGVACEIGIAYTHGLPIIGLYTDIRQYRTGQGRMYKNLYVTGAIEASGKIVENLDELIRYLDETKTNQSSTRTHPEQHFGAVAKNYVEFVNRLESWYSPHWTISKFLKAFFTTTPTGKRILEFGCGSGDLSVYLAGHNLTTQYIGYDKSPEMIKIAKLNEKQGVFFTDSWNDVHYQADQQSFDMAFSFFTLHDIERPEIAVKSISECIHPEGRIIICDLSTWDLPQTTSLLQKELAQPIAIKDKRFNTLILSEIASLSGCIIEKVEMITPSINFPSKKDLLDYLEFFGIFGGMDLPLGLTLEKADFFRPKIEQILQKQEYPFNDQRAFIVCQLRKVS